MARYVSRVHNLPLLSEVARAIMNEEETSISSIRHDIDRVNSYQIKIFERQIVEEKKLKSFVSDRGFDNLAYSCEHTTIFRDMLFRPDLQKYIDGLRSSNVIIFFIRPNKSIIVNDGVRETVDWDGMNKIDSYVKFMLEMWGLRHFSVESSSMQERIRLVDSVISMVGANET